MAIKEIYAKDINDPNYQSTLIDHSDIYETVLSKIRMILYTKPGEVLGDSFFGVNLDEYVFALNASNQTIRELIEKQISQYVPEALVMTISVDVSFAQGKSHDTCFIDIKINGENAMGLMLS
jgi:phage baseplate assembly protein W